jgi:hypothetical protein
MTDIETLSARGYRNTTTIYAVLVTLDAQDFVDDTNLSLSLGVELEGR